MFGVGQGSYTIAQIVAIRSVADAGGMQHEKKETDPGWDDVAMVRVLQVLLSESRLDCLSVAYQAKRDDFEGDALFYHFECTYGLGSCTAKYAALAALWCVWFGCTGTVHGPATAVSRTRTDPDLSEPRTTKP